MNNILVPEDLLPKELRVPEEIRRWLKQHEADVMRKMFETIDAQIMGTKNDISSYSDLQ